MEQLGVLIAIASEEIRTCVRKLLISGGYSVIAEARDGYQALRLARTLRPDLVLAEDGLPGMSGIELGRILAAEKIAPVLVIAKERLHLFQEVASGKDRVEPPIGYVMPPLAECNLFPAIENLLSYYSYSQALELEIKNLHEKIETRKVVERAKGILMDKYGLTEAEAYRRIQKQSMDKCLPMRNIAEAIILAHELNHELNSKDE